MFDIIFFGIGTIALLAFVAVFAVHDIREDLEFTKELKRWNECVKENNKVEN